MSTAKEAHSVSEISSRLVTFPGPNACRIVGYIDEGDENLWNQRVVVLAPRYGETKKNNLQIAYLLAANGFKVLRFDQTNHIGESDGSMDQFTLSGATDDILSAVAYVDRFLKPDEIILMAVSLSARCGYRACSKDPRIARFVSLVGMVDLDSTLKAIYNRDIFAEFRKGVEWESIDILGFDINADNFYRNVTDSHMLDLTGTFDDAKLVNIPVLHLRGEQDLWVEPQDVEKVLKLCKLGRLVVVPGVGHEIHANPKSLQFVFAEIVMFCREGLPASESQMPDQKELLKQNKEERLRMQRLVKLESEEDVFWGSYLKKFGIIEQAEYYVDYFHELARQLGPLKSHDVMLDAGCGNGFHGICTIRSLLHTVAEDLDVPQPVHYCGVDLTRGGLERSYARHTEALVDLGRQKLFSTTGIGFSYRKLDFDQLEEANYILPFASGSINKICSSLVLSYLKTPQLLMNEFYRLLKPGGVVVVSSMKPGCDMTVLYHDSIAANYSESHQKDGQKLLSAAGKIKLKQELGVYQFFDAEELEYFALHAGFKFWESTRSFGDQANVIRIIK